MSKGRFLRFSLAKLIGAITVVAIFFGYAHWRRHAILREADALERHGITLLWEDGWTHSFWPIVPKQAKHEYHQLPGANWRVGAKTFTEHELGIQYAHSCDRLKALGVEEVRLDLNGVPGNSYTSTSRGMSHQP
jgi:hypothetical protein